MGKYNKILSIMLISFIFTTSSFNSVYLSVNARNDFTTSSASDDSIDITEDDSDDDEMDISENIKESDNVVFLEDEINKDSETFLYVSTELDKDSAGEVENIYIEQTSLDEFSEYSIYNAFYIYFTDDDGDNTEPDNSVSLEISGSLIDDAWDEYDLFIYDDDEFCLADAEYKNRKIYIEVDTDICFVFAKERTEEELSNDICNINITVSGMFCDTDDIIIEEIDEDYLDEIPQEDNLIIEQVAVFKISFEDWNEEMFDAEINEITFSSDEDYLLYAVADDEINAIGEVSNTLNYNDELPDVFVVINAREPEEIKFTEDSTNINVEVVGDELTLDGVTGISVSENSNKITAILQKEMQNNDIEDYILVYSFDISLSGEKEPSDEVEVSLSGDWIYKLIDCDYVLIHFAEDGLEFVDFEIDNSDTISFSTDEFSYYGIVGEEDKEDNNDDAEAVNDGESESDEDEEDEENENEDDDIAVILKDENDESDSYKNDNNADSGIATISEDDDDGNNEEDTDSGIATISEDDDVSTIADTGTVEEIVTFGAVVRSGATLNDNGDYVWEATYSASGHKYKFGVSFAISGGSSGDEAVIEAAVITKNENGDLLSVESNFEIRIPYTILVDTDGNAADTVYMSYPSVDELDSMTDEEYEEADGFAWYYDESTGEIVIFNFKDISVSTAGSFEVSYETSEESFYYYDYDADDSTDDDILGTFYANITITNPDGSTLYAESNEIDVYMDTTAEILTTAKSYPKLYKAWQSSWGDTTDDYDEDDWYLVWTITSKIDEPTQFYNFVLTDTITSCTIIYEDDDGNQLSVDLTEYMTDAVVGIKLSGVSGYDLDDGSTDTRTDYSLSGDGYRYDSVLTKIDGDLLTYTDENGTVYTAVYITITNKITSSVESTYGSDVSSLSASRTFYWNFPVFGGPGVGYVYFMKHGNEDWTTENTHWDGAYFSYDWPYASYELDELQDESDSTTSIGDIMYWTEMAAYSREWTATDTSDYTTYGTNSVSYQIKDDTLYLLKAGDLDQDGNLVSTSVYYDSSNYETAGLIYCDDYDFEKVEWNIKYIDYVKDSDGATIDDEAEFITSSVSASKTDELTLYIKSGSEGDATSDLEWIEAGTYYIKSGVWEPTEEGEIYVASFTSDTITFNDGVDGYKIVTENAYYYTYIGLYSYVKLYGTENVLSWTGCDADGTSEEIVVLKNVASITVKQTDEDGETEDLGYAARVIGDRLIRSQKISEITKKFTMATSDANAKTYTLTWKIEVNETSITGTGEVSYVSQDSGTVYDLLPYGSTYESDSVVVENQDGVLDSSSYKVTFIDNWNNSGQQLVVIKIKEPGDYYIVYLNSVHSWDSIADNGSEIVNLAAYETGNDEISDGYADNGGVSEDKETGELYYTFSEEYTEYMSGLSSSIVTSNTFIYYDGEYDLTTEISASTNLAKKVRSEDDSTYSSSTTVDRNGTYSYRLRYMNTYLTTSSDIIFFDSLENYTEDGVENDWQGTLVSIDTSQAEGKGCAPVIYYSAVEGLDLTLDQNRDLANTDVWLEESVFLETYTLEDVTAIAVDCRTDENGDEFVLGEGESLSIIVYMQAPDYVEDADSLYPETHNEVYLQIKSGDDADTVTIYNHYTTVKYHVTADIPVIKVSANDNSEVISSITFRLWGASSYGTVVDTTETTDRYGELWFEDIEAGTYILQEYESTSDWLMNYSEFVVVIDTSGNVTITDEDGNVVVIGADGSITCTMKDSGIIYTKDADGNVTVTDSDGNMLDADDYTTYDFLFVTDDGELYFMIEDSPRIHGSLEFSKLNYVTGRSVEGVVFMLSGTSDYGNEILLYATSDEDGTVSFPDIEKGTYTLTEISTVDGYALNIAEYTVTVDTNGIVSMTGDEYFEETASYEYAVYNVPLTDFLLIKQSSYDYSVIQGVVFHLYGTSDTGTEVDMYVTSDESGFLWFTDLEPGTYILVEYGYEGYTYTDEDGNEVEVTAEDIAALYSLDSTKRVVSITATTDEDGNNVVEIEIDGLTVNESGNYYVINNAIPNGTVEVIKKWEGEVPEDYLPTIYLVASGMTVAEILITDSDGNAVSGADITIYQGTDEDAYRTFTTNSEGYYVTALEPGYDYVILYNGSTYAVSVNSAGVISTEDDNISLDLSGSISIVNIIT